MNIYAYTTVCTIAHAHNYIYMSVYMYISYILFHSFGNNPLPSADTDGVTGLASDNGVSSHTLTFTLFYH